MRRLAVLLLIGCAHPAPRISNLSLTCNPSSEDVELAYVGRAVQEPGFDGEVLVTLWRVTNPYRVPVTVTRWSYQLSVAGAPVPGPMPDPPVTVPARSCQNVELKARLDYQALFGPRAPPSSTFSASVSPLISGGPHGELQPTRTATGTYDAAQVPALRVGRLHVTRGGDSFTVDLDLMLTNLNDFPVKLDALDGELLISGNRFSRLQARELVLEPRGSQLLPFRLSAAAGRLNGLARAALSSTEAISTDINLSLTIGGQHYTQSTGGMIYPR